MLAQAWGCSYYMLMIRPVSAFTLCEIEITVLPSEALFSACSTSSSVWACLLYTSVSQSIQRYVYPLTWLIIGFVALVAGCIYFYTRRFVAVLLHIHSFLSEVASGNLNATLDHSVTKRSDELGDIGRCALSMQRSLRTMIEQDALTELYNRRSGEKKLRQIFDEARSSRHSFALAIGCLLYTSQ